MQVADMERLRLRLAELGHAPTPSDVAAAMRSLGQHVDDRVLVDVVERLRRESTGAGLLEPLLRQPGVTDVLVNGPDRVFVDRGHGLEPAGVTFASDEDVRRLAVRLATSIGRRLDDGSPYVDARLADGTRLHAILAPLADPGTCLSLRVPAGRRFSLEQWVASGSVPPAGAEVLEAMVAARVAFLVAGGTGSGKTTLLASMLARVPHDERLLVVEDSRELDPDHPHCVRLESRAANAEGAGAVPLSLLVKQALRMRPDRVVVGEVRGAEVCDLLQALNTGHEGGCGTIHANSAADVPARLEALAALGGMSREALHLQAGAALDAVVHVRREPRSGVRRVTGIHVVDRGPDGLTVTPALEFFNGRVRRGPGGDVLERWWSR
ncbi:TadA family conjugal transfer-associated ATPase [Mariniluteicoccus endophyticus]